MRLRGLVFERFAGFERAEVNLCDEAGAPLDVVLLVGEAGAGKTALLRGISGLLSEAAGGDPELGPLDVLRGKDEGRCRVVFDDVVDRERVVLTLEKELARRSAPARNVRALPANLYDRWQAAVGRDDAPRAAFSIEGGVAVNDDDDETVREQTGPDPLIAWAADLVGGPAWDAAREALDQVLWPWRFDSVHEGDLVFAGPSGLFTSGELGDAFGSMLIIVLELLRLSTGRPDAELLYVVDDIDANLHPRAQASLLGDLRRAFPRVQLVATTHSPWLVASVEPSQVYRLERAGATTTVGRVSDRVNRSAAVSAVMDLAFGAPELPGPRWANAPPLAFRAEVLAEVDPRLRRGAIVYALPDPIHVRDVRNAFGEAVLPLLDSGMGHLFFVDLTPGLAWGHPCEYVFRTREGTISGHEAIWPPADLERFVPIGRR